MTMHNVTITEEIREVREYDIEADTPQQAAEIAQQKWVNAGEEPARGPYVMVMEREYAVNDGTTSYDFTVCDETCKVDD